MEQREALLALLDEPTRKEVTALLAYAEDQAGGLMNPRYARVRPDMTVDEALSYLRKQARAQARDALLRVRARQRAEAAWAWSVLRELFTASPDKHVRDVMHTDLVSVTEDQDQEDVSRLFAETDLVAVPVVDADGRIKGIVTVDDIVDVVQRRGHRGHPEVRRHGGAGRALPGSPASGEMVKKRGGWLSALFLGEMLTATAMTYFEDEIAKAVVLALFVPLIISSGGNSGSQASTLVIRAMALEEVRLRDWWRVMRRELVSGLALGVLLGSIGFLRIVIWQMFKPTYGPHYVLVAETVCFSLIGVVMFGTLTGSLLPFLLRRLGLDPASASAPFVATLVDVTGLIIYFGAATMILTGTLL